MYLTPIAKKKSKVPIKSFKILYRFNTYTYKNVEGIP
jgi:hypothetical protein